MCIKDIYLYDDIPLFKNFMNVKNEELFKKAEGYIIYICLLNIDDKIKENKFNYNRFKAIYQYIFGDIYE